MRVLSRRRLRAIGITTAIVAAMLVWTPQAGPSAEAVPVASSELAGTDRFATAAAVASAVQPSTGGTVLLATGANYPDALAAGPVAAKLNAPILLVHGSTVPQATKDALTRLRPSRIIIIGGLPAVPSAAERTVAGLAPSARIERVAGADRHETAAKLATQFFPGASEVFVATGWNFPDALSAGATAAMRGAPILLGTGRGLTARTWTALSSLRPDKLWLVGGSNVLGHDPAGQRVTIPAERLSGPDRYATNAAVLDRFSARPTHSILVASGAKFPDALVSAPLAAVRKAPLVLTLGSCTGGAARSSALRLLGIHPHVDSSERRVITRIGAGISREAAYTDCTSRASAVFEAPPASTIVRPAGLQPYDVTPTEIRRVVELTNRVRTENGMPALAADRFLVGTGPNSLLSHKHAVAHGTLPAHEGHLHANEVVAFNGDSFERFWDLQPSRAMLMWWNSPEHREIMYARPGMQWSLDDSPGDCIVINATRTRETSNRGWDSYLDARAAVVPCSLVAEGQAVRAPDVDTSLKQYRPPAVPSGARYDPNRNYNGGSFELDPDLFWDAYEAGSVYSPWVP